jgi:Sec-independent protein translocase protein TatA
MNWLTDLSPDRLARVQSTHKALGVTIGGPAPDPVAFQVKAQADMARATAERVWVDSANAWTRETQKSMQGYNDQVQAHTAKTEAERQKLENAKRLATEKDRERDEEHRSHLHSRIEALALEGSESIAAIRQEIADILGA